MVLSKSVERLLLVLPLQAQLVDGRAYVDKQACNGLRLWLENFETVTLACPAFTRATASPDVGAIDLVKGRDRLTFVPLPTAYTPHRFAVALPGTARLLLAHIRKATHLHFAIGGLWGDWASVACLLAGRRPYAVWTDRVEHRVAAFSATTKHGARRIYTLATSQLMARYEKMVIQRAALGLFHGADCFNAYAKFSKNPRLVHDIHVDAADLISIQQLDARSSRGGPLRIAYAGRVHPDKGALDWIDTMSILASTGASFEATWFGDGPALGELRDRAAALGLSTISFPGALPHDDVLRRLKAQDVFVFCHKTPESPRCLIEALQCGLPIVGYESAYPRDLIGENGGGILTPANEPATLANILSGLANDRATLRALSLKAVRDGTRFDAGAVFRHRSQLMKTVPVD